MTSGGGRLNHHELAVKSAKRRQTHNAHKADAHAGNGNGHLAAKAAQIGKLAAACAHDESARAKEEQVFHDGVVEHVPQSARGREPCANAEHKGDFANLPKGRVGQHAFDVILAQGHDFTIHQGGRAHGNQASTQPRKAEQAGHAHNHGPHEQHHNYAKHAHLGDDTRKGTRHGRRRGGVSVGQPRVQGHKAHLDGKTGKAKHKRALNKPGRKRGITQQQQAGQHEQRAARAHYIIFKTSIVGTAVVLMHHQEVGGEGHEFPVAIHARRVARGNNARQRGEGQQQEEPVAAMALMDVAQRVHADHQSHNADHDQEELGGGGCLGCQCGKERQRGSGHAHQGSAVKLYQEGCASGKGTKVVTPVCRVCCRMWHGHIIGRSQHAGDGPAKHAKQGHNRSQTQHQKDVARGGRPRAGAFFYRGVEHGDAHGFHMQPDKHSGCQGHAQQSRHGTGHAAQYASADKHARFRHKEW